MSGTNTGSTVEPVACLGACTRCDWQCEFGVNRAVSRVKTQYSSNELLQLNVVRPAGVSDITLQLPDVILRNSYRIFGERSEKKRQKQGKRGGSDYARGNDSLKGLRCPR